MQFEYLPNGVYTSYESFYGGPRTSARLHSPARPDSPIAPDYSVTPQISASPDTSLMSQTLINPHISVTPQTPVRGETTARSQPSARRSTSARPPTQRYRIKLISVIFPGNVLPNILSHSQFFCRILSTEVILILLNSNGNVIGILDHENIARSICDSRHKRVSINMETGVIR